jgi:hypothetical protein
MILLSSLGIVSFNAGAQVTGTSQIPIKPCLEANTTNKLVKEGKIRCKDNSSFFLSVAALKGDLEPKGVIFEKQDGIIRDKQGQEIGKVTDKNGRLVVSPPTIRFPQGKPITLIQGGSRGYYDTQFEYSKDFVDADVFILESLRQTGLPVSMVGWGKPKITVGQTQFEIALDQNSNGAQYLYGSIRRVLVVHSPNHNRKL